MALDHLLLALLAQGPAHGYRLRARLEAELGTQRPVETSHVYAALAGLERKRLAVSRVERDGRGRSRRMFDLTAAGHERQRALGELPAACRTLLRRPLLLKTVIAALLGERLGRRTLRAERTLRERLLRELDASSPATEVARLLRDRDRRHLEVEVWLLDALEARAAATARPPASGSR